MKQDLRRTIGLGVYSVCSLISMAVMSLGIAPAVVLGLPIRLPWTPAMRRYLMAAALLTLACAISLLAAYFAPLAYGGHAVEVRFFPDLAKTWYLFWPLILAAGLTQLSDLGRRRVLQAWLLTFGALSVLGIFQFYLGWPRPQMIPGYEPHYHVTLFLGHHLSVASILIFPYFAALDLSFRADGPSQCGLSRSTLQSLVGLGTVALFATFSRMLWIALPVGVLVWVLWALPKRWALGMVAVGSLFVAVLSQAPAIQKRLHSFEGTTTRTALWNANLEFFRARPLTGTGWHHNLELSGYYLMERNPNNPDIFSGHAHNNALEMLSGTGLIGLFAWLFWCGVTLSFLFKVVRRTDIPHFARGLVCAWIVFQINGLTQVNFWESKVLHQMMLMVAWSIFWAGLPTTKAHA